ncbi:MAG: OST-HTH/LOTUS domain-containing protein, partial [Alphaproteobacteria bacterium]
GGVGTQLQNLASDFDSRTFGFRKLSDLVRKTNAFEIDHPEGGSLRIRLRNDAPAAAPEPAADKPKRRSRRGAKKSNG